MQPALALAAFFLAAMLASAPVMAAQECVCREQPLVEQVRAASMVFHGEVGYPYPDQAANEAVFASSAILKGTRLIKPRVASNRPGGAPECAVRFELGRAYNVIAFGTFEAGYYTDACLTHMAASPQEGLAWMQEVMRLRGEDAMAYIAANSMTPEVTLLELEKIRQQAKTQLGMYNPELALRLYVRAAQISRNSAVDLLGQGRAYLRLMMATLALERFDDVLEKDSSSREAWSGRYQALMLLGRWQEVPGEKADLTGFFWHHAADTLRLKAPVFAKGWLDDLDLAGSSLPGADFSGAILTDVSFSGADLTGATFKDTELRAVNFSGADLTGADLSFRKAARLLWDDKTRWPEGFDPAGIPDALKATASGQP